MRYIKLRDLEVSRIGLGTMGMSHGYTDSGTDEAESVRTLHRALELGVTLIDTAEIYGPTSTRSCWAARCGAAATRSCRRRSSAWSRTPDDIAPILGTKRVQRVEEKTSADDVRLTAEQLDRLSSLPPAAGETHTEAGLRMLER
ncbi:hypothetical protein SL103_25250 [Streptomyces lydicus]|uniref:NADP-dependent oxidoreductase domain-containing protein n=1 Tax=Streptomyces lydicus TaxID=47763 RepID=A0A1D7VQX9_9ACTN|nr:hypothetical protein SL103_25250 [Streptomyces lydicus]